MFEVIETVWGNAEPSAQPVTAGVVKGHAAAVGCRARSLTDQQNGRVGAKLKHRFGPQWQMFGAFGALAYLLNE